jgi:G3E family GTPase
MVLLLDGTQPEAPFEDDVLHITMQQAAQADVVAVNKVDSADLEQVGRLERSLKDFAPQVAPYKISMASGEGLRDLFAAIFADGERR